MHGMAAHTGLSLSTAPPLWGMARASLAGGCLRVWHKHLCPSASHMLPASWFLSLLGQVLLPSLPSPGLAQWNGAGIHHVATLQGVPT